MIGSFGRRNTFVLDPLVIILKKMGLSPNALSIIGLIMCIASGFCFAIGNFAGGSLSLIVAGLLDILDGKLARDSRLPTPDSRLYFGAFLDSSLDRYGDSFVFFGIIYYYRENPILVIVGLLALMGAYLTSYTKARAEKWIEMNVGILERPERILLLIIGGLTRMDIILWILAIFSNITAIQRIVYVMRNADCGIKKSLTKIN
ncbi:MAG: CDP-alcohol phosphatidyltransferase family protein [bacterium]